MRYIKMFENTSKYNIGEYNICDYVILIKEDEDTKYYGYNIGDLCQMSKINYNNTYAPYRIINITNTNLSYLWVEPDQIRKAEDWEIKQIKYNL